MRMLSMWDAGVESPLDGYRADQLMAAAAAVEPEHAFLRLWTRPSVALSVGRYHRIDERVGAGLQRRLSGGRVVPVGPDVLGLTLVLSSSRWLSGSSILRPEQVLNRALRLVLAVLRGFGVDAFYGGRDLVTVGTAPVAYASFCPFADGVVAVEQLVACGASFASLERLAALLDPQGVSVGAPAAFSCAKALAELGLVVERGAWLEALARRAPDVFSSSVRQLARVPCDLAGATAADGEAYSGFLRERGIASPGATTVATAGMMGLVEAAAVIDGGKVRSLEIAGDLIAPFETLEALAIACAGECADRAALARVVARELSAPGRFVLGLLDLEQLVARVA